MVTLTIICIIILVWAYKAQAKAEKQVDAVDAHQRESCHKQITSREIQLQRKEQIRKCH